MKKIIILLLVLASVVICVACAEISTEAQGDVECQIVNKIKTDIEIDDDLIFVSYSLVKMSENNELSLQGDIYIMDVLTLKTSDLQTLELTRLIVTVGDKDITYAVVGG